MDVSIDSSLETNICSTSTEYSGIMLLKTTSVSGESKEGLMEPVSCDTTVAESESIPDSETSPKQSSVSDVSEPSSRSQDASSRRTARRTLTDCGEGPSGLRMKRKLCDFQQNEEEAAPSSDNDKDDSKNYKRRQKEPASCDTTAAESESIPDSETSPKQSSVSDVSEPSPRSQEDSSRRTARRTLTDCGEGPSELRMKRKLCVFQQNEEEAAPSSDNDKVEDGNKKKKVVKEPMRRRTRVTKNNGSAEGRTPKRSTAAARRAQFEAKYFQLGKLGQGGCGAVFAGVRREDDLPVAIKHIPKDKVHCKEKDKNGKSISSEVACMLKMEEGTRGLVGQTVNVSLLDWYDLHWELIVVMERPMPSRDLNEYLMLNGGSLEEDEAKIILRQLVDAAKQLEEKNIFHRDIKTQNILIETGSAVPRVRLIDFGLSCFFKKKSLYRAFCGTPAHIPPEWIENGCHRAGPTTVWQMGVVLYDVLHRFTEFDTEEFVKKRIKISDMLSEECINFLQMCLSESPKDRPTLEELLCHPWLY